jgi:hypothetical protein
MSSEARHPEAGIASDALMPVDFSPYDHFSVEQLVRPVVNLYRISSGPTPLAFVRQKRMAIKEDIRFFRDEAESEELFRIKARAVLELGGRYDVTTPEGEGIGVLEKVFGRSLLRSTWRALDAAENEVAWTQEKSLPIAILRRVIDFVPYGELVPIPFHFTIARGEQQLGELTRRFGFRDRYELDLSGDPDKTLDRRVAVAWAIALDALQSR